MNVLQVFGLVFIATMSHAVDWQDIKSPMETRYKAQIDEMYASIPAPNVTRTGRITNGIQASLGQFPYQVYMLLSESSGATYLCGGSIIHERWILTAAHCVIDMVRVEVYLGALTRYQTGTGAYVQMVTVTNKRSIVVHPNYDSDLHQNDVGLVELPSEAQVAHSYIGKLALPTGADAIRNLVGTEATVSGFGRFNASSYSSAYLQFVRLPIIENIRCSETFTSAYVSDSNICLSSSNGRSACSGDSGGPLTVVSQTSSQPVIVGIVSYGSARGCELNYPQVFARVTSFIGWIESATGVTFT